MMWLSTRQIKHVHLPTSAAAAAAASRASVPLKPLMAAYMPRCSSTVISGHRMSNWGQQPRSARMLGMSVRMERPFITASPLVGVSIPVSMEMAVVFPAPLWPAAPLQYHNTFDHKSERACWQGHARCTLPCNADCQIVRDGCK